MARLLSDLGEVLRTRLVNHPSEPEANRIAVPDYGALSRPEYGDLESVIDGAVVWSVLHLETSGQAFRPKGAGRPPSAEMIVNRVYCPALGMSPRARWRVNVRLL